MISPQARIIKRIVKAGSKKPSHALNMKKQRLICRFFVLHGILYKQTALILEKVIEISIAPDTDVWNDTPVRPYVARLYPDIRDYEPTTVPLSPSMWTMPETRASRIRPFVAHLFAESPTIPDEPVDTEMETRMRRMQAAHDEMEQNHGRANATPDLLKQIIRGLKRL